MTQKEVLERKGMITSLIVYDEVCKNPGLSIYEYSKILGFSNGKTRGAIKRLEEKGLVETELIPGNPHNKRIVKPVPAKELFSMFVKLEGFEE